MHSFNKSVVFLLANYFAITAWAQSWNVISKADFSDWFNVTEFPQAQVENVSYWQTEAYKLAGADLYPWYQSRCIISSQKYPELGNNANGFIAPARAFDSVYFLGHAFVTAWAIDTGAGLILIDSLQNPDEVERILLPGLKAFGYTGSDVKALIITHEHFDHFGGAKYMQDNFGTTIYATGPAWQAMGSIAGTPRKNMTVGDGDVVQLGNTTIKVVNTPGHTVGTLSLIFPVYDRGCKHIAGLWGGLGHPSGGQLKSMSIQSYRKFRAIAESNKVDVLMGNHQTHDQSVQNLDMLANRECKGAKCSIKNPYIVGNEAYTRFLTVMEMCLRVGAARKNEILTV